MQNPTTNGAKHVYLDHAASTPLAEPVWEAMLPWLKAPGNASSIHHYGRQLKTAIEKARRTVADLLGVAPAEIVFTSGGTEADNFAIKGSVLYRGVRRILTSPLEHHAVLHAAEACQAHGATVALLPVDETGALDLAELEHRLKTDDTPTLVSLMHANNEVGTLYDIADLGEICQANGAIFHSDTVQTVGLFARNWSTTPVDYITAGAHKFNGPRGVGFLYCAPGCAMKPLLDGGAQERNQRGGTEYVAGIVGLAKALELALSAADRKRAKLQERKDYFWMGLKNLYADRVLLNGPQEVTAGHPGILNVAFPGHFDGMLPMALDVKGVACSGGSACSSGSVSGSHVLSGLGYGSVRIGNSVRFSFGALTTFEELDFALQAVAEAVGTPEPAKA